MARKLRKAKVRKPRVIAPRPGAERFGTVMDAVSDLVVIVDGNRTCLYVSASFDRMRNVRQPWIGADFLTAVHADDRAKVNAFLDALLRGGSPPDIEHRYLSADGTVVVVQTRGILLGGGRSRTKEIALISRDVTEQRHSQTEIRLLAQAVSSTRDAFCLTDLQDNLLFVNPAFCDTYGYIAEEVLGKSIECVRSPKNPPEVLATILPATLRGGWYGELINRRKDGIEFPVELWTSPVLGESGEPVACVGIARLITQRKLTEQELQETSERLQLTLDNLDVIVYELDAEGHFLLSRGKGLEKLGLLPEQVVGASLFEFYRDQPDILDAFLRARDGSPVTFETEVNGLLWFANFIPLRDGRGQVERIFGTAFDITERKRAEEALSHESQLWHTLMDNIPDAIYFKDTESRFVRVNSAQAELLGVLATSEAVGKSDADFNPPDEAAVSVADDRYVMTTGNPIIGKIERLTSGNGTTRWYSTTKIPMRNKERKIIGIIGSSRDITQLKQAEELESVLYRIAEETSSAGDLQKLFAAIHGIVGKLMYVKNFYIALYDEQEHRLAFPYFVDEVDTPPAPGSAGKGLTAYVLRTGKSLLCDEQMTEELARRGEAEVVGVPSPIWLGVPLIVNQKTIGVMVVQHYSDPHAYGDRERQILEFVSSQVAKAIEHKRDEEALRLSEEKYRGLFEDSHDGILITLPSGQVVDINKAGVALLGLASRDEVCALPSIADLYENPSEGEFYKRSLARRGSIQDFEITIRRPDGQRRIVLASAIAVRDDAGTAVAYREFLRDVTERRKLEEQLRQAQKMEGIGTLAGGIAHDFNNLLGIILGYTSLLERGAMTPQRTKQSIETIKRAVQRGADLVRQLLTFARKGEPVFTNLQVNETIHELVRMLAETFPRTIRITTELQDNLPKILADPTQLSQALLNLSVNALDAMVDETPGGSPSGSLTFQTGTVAGKLVHERFPNAVADDYVVIRVKDSGAGMDEATKRRIFEPFFTTKGVGKGTGLGLAVVYGVINSHHGFIDVDSAKGVGTTFILHFPVQEEAPPPPRLADAPLPASRRTVLLVEDESMLLDLLKSFLEENGYTAITARDGQEAMEIFTERSGEINIVLSDMGLPRLGGWEMFQKMKQLRPNVKVILASAFFDPDLKKELISAGVVAFIQKPYVSDGILEEIRRALGESNGSK